MRKFILQAINQFDDTVSGNAAANVEFNVYNASGGLADIYTNDGSGLISQTSPLLTDTNGKYEFYADNGRYSILFADETVALQNDLTDIAIYEYGSAGARDAATTAEAIAGVTNKIPDTIGVKAAIDAAPFFKLSANNDYFRSNGVTQLINLDGQVASSGSLDAPLNIVQLNLTSGDAFISFLLSNRHAAYFGLDGDTNDLFYGGWAEGTNKYKVHHDGNTSFNTFSDVAGASPVEYGFIFNSSTAFIVLRINSKIRPTGITATGTFELRNTGGAVIKTAIPASDITVDFSSERIVRLVVPNLTGLVSGDIVELRALTTESKIEVNF